MAGERLPASLPVGRRHKAICKTLANIKMTRILLTTIISAIGVMLVFSTIGALVEWGWYIGGFLYLLTLGTGNIIAPTFGAVLIDRLISQFVKSRQNWIKLIIRMILLGISMFIGLWTWSILDVKVYYGSFSEITYDRVVDNFNSDFYGWLRVGFMLMIAIPLVDNTLKRRKKEKHLPTMAKKT